MALEAVALFILTVILFGLVPLIKAIELGVFSKFIKVLLVSIVLGSLLVYGIARLEEEGKRELMLIAALIGIPLLFFSLHFMMLHED